MSWHGVSLLLALCQQLVTADLPVHCLHHQISGQWKFYLGQTSDQRSSCGHARPDSQDYQPSRLLAVESKSPKGHGIERELLISLDNPNSAETAGHPKGTWTMIYDEGFEVEVAGMNFFAFSNFTYDTDAVDPLALHNVSHCEQTMVGWYRNEERTQFGCYFASKVDAKSSAKSSAKPSNKSSSMHALKKKAKSLLYQMKLSLHHQKKVVDKLNDKLDDQDLGWKAKVMDKWSGLSMLQVNSYAGIKRSLHARQTHEQMLRQHAEKQKAHDAAKPRSFLQQSSHTQRKHRHGHHAAKLDGAGLPLAWDWSNVNGQSFLEPVMDQSDCGSCYAASAMRMLSARHKISQNNTAALPWSINFPLMCSEYNQGCKGGYGILIAKWSQEIGLLPATCMKYDTEGSCKLECNLDELQGKRFRAGKHRYVGSFYGATHDRVNAIKSELYHNGPIILGLEPGEDFMWYSDGIYRSPKGANVLHPSSGAEWERVDHAVLLVGYGEEKGQKYWKIQNTWGEEWGENGFFRIVMGENDSGIESIPEAADVIEDEQDGKQVEVFFDELSKGEGALPPPSNPRDKLARELEALLQVGEKLKAKEDARPADALGA
eukprot:gb/GFBE01070263.1/.p1 GENE.gb/GFBE01070263.1/~~gb/GFBE01070263.1/.p1  ORF type:complete len:601 (+),score=177.55 gb/GFBE01070263.1/:1-1803(+)